MCARYVTLSHFYDYTAFGSSLRGDRSLTNYAFTGQVIDKNTNMHYNRSRFYLNSMGRWISIDPIIDENSFYSPYVYVADSPVRNLDPSGMSALTELVSTLSIVCTIAACVNALVGFGIACWGAFMDDAEDDDEEWWLESCLGFVYQVGPISISAGRCTSIAPSLGKCVRSLYFHVGIDVAYMLTTYWKTKWTRDLGPSIDTFFERLAYWIYDKSIGAGMTIGSQLIMTPIWIFCQMMSCLNSPMLACDELSALNFLKSLRFNADIMKTVQVTSVGTESYVAYYPFAKAKDLTGLSLYAGISFTGANWGICRGMTGFGDIFGFDVKNWKVKPNTAFGVIWSGGFRAGLKKGWAANVTLDIYAKMRI